MGKRVQRIRHSTGTANAFTGLPGEITVDTTKKEIRVHDGLTAGGIAGARADVDNVQAATSVQDGKMTAAQVVSLLQAVIDIAAIQGIIPATAGVAEANKVLQLGPTKNADTLDVALNGLKIATVAITRTAADINALVTLAGVETVTNKTLDETALIRLRRGTNERQIQFTDNAGLNPIYFYGLPTASSWDVGLFDGKNTRGVWNYDESAGVFQVQLPLHSTNAVLTTPAITGGTINGAAASTFVPLPTPTQIISSATFDSDVLMDMSVVYPAGVGAIMAQCSGYISVINNAGGGAESQLLCHSSAPGAPANQYRKVIARDQASGVGTVMAKGLSSFNVPLDVNSDFYWRHRIISSDAVNPKSTLVYLTGLWF